MNRDDQLSALLRQWRDIEAPGNFEANVWRRIRLAQAEPPARITLAEWLRQLVWQPAFSVGVALAIVIGAVGGMRAAPVPATRAHPEVGFLSAGTLAGGYTQLIAGDS